jgi:DNA-binding transcriptional ArsR family regulator
VSLFKPTAGGIGMARAERLAAAFTALSEPHRLRILSLMAQQEWTTGVELERNMPLSQPTVAYHGRAGDARPVPPTPAAAAGVRRAAGAAGALDR